MQSADPGIALEAPLASGRVRARLGSPVFVFTLAASLLGLVLVFLTPPFQVADEPQHFLRAYQISEGQLVAQPLSVSTGGVLPRSLNVTLESVPAGLPRNPEGRQDRQVLWSALHMPLASGDRMEITFWGAAVYFPVVYLPQALGILPARLLEAPPLVLMYLARLANLALAVVLTALALSLMPFHRWSFGLLSLTPMVLFQRASVSADAMTLGACMLLVALCFHHGYVRTGPLRPRDYLSLLGAGLLVALCKQAYLPLLGLFLVIPVARLGSKGRYAAAFAVMLIVPTVCQLAWMLYAKDLYRPVGVTHVDVPGQIAFVKAHPWRTVEVVFNHLVTDRQRLWREFMGHLGWLDTRLPDPLLATLGILIALVAFLDGGTDAHPRPLTRAVTFIAMLGGTFCVLFLLYIGWTPVGADFVGGVQGRYLIPLAPLLLVLVTLPRRRIPQGVARLKPVLVTLFLVLTAAVTIQGLYQRYWS